MNKEKDCGNGMMASAEALFDEIGKGVYIFAGVLPFNAIKDTVTCVVFTIVFKYIMPHVSKLLK